MDSLPEVTSTCWAHVHLWGLSNETLSKTQGGGKKGAFLRFQKSGWGGEGILGTMGCWEGALSRLGSSVARAWNDLVSYGILVGGA